MPAVVVQLDDTRATALREAWEKCKALTGPEWVETHLTVAVKLAEERARYEPGADVAFSQRLDEIGLGDMEKNARAAYITLGRNPELARTVLTQTQRRSIRLIVEYEWEPAGGERFPTVGNDPEAPRRGRPRRTITRPREPVNEPVSETSQETVTPAPVAGEAEAPVTAPAETAPETPPVTAHLGDVTAEAPRTLVTPEVAALVTPATVFNAKRGLELILTRLAELPEAVALALALEQDPEAVAEIRRLVMVVQAKLSTYAAILEDAD